MPCSASPDRIHRAAAALPPASPRSSAAVELIPHPLPTPTIQSAHPASLHLSPCSHDLNDVDVGLSLPSPTPQSPLPPDAVKNPSQPRTTSSPPLCPCRLKPHLCHHVGTAICEREMEKRKSKEEKKR
ncbi:hypothetical protein M0R45_030434 [Rubus argutus]|uniref:Uncharacterized protein n=1 Tax=Rubus argutus TaxID=59490 RepID=A0AAW1WBU0_RUBAR